MCCIHTQDGCRRLGSIDIQYHARRISNSSQSQNNHPEAQEKRAGDKVIFPSTASELYLLQLTFFSLPASRLTVAKVRLSHTQKELLMPGTLLLDGFVRAMKMLCSGG